jgi:hypothetical protein
MSPPYSRFLALMFCVPLAPPLAAQAKGPRCDENLIRLASAVNGYQQRGDRCEGLYGKQVSGTSLYLASFTQFFESYDLRQRDSLTVSWPPQVNRGELSIRAETVRRGRYYRMDTQQQASSGDYRWSNSVLSNAHIARQDLGVIGWVDAAVGGTSRQLLVPLVIWQTGSPTSCPVYELSLMPGERLQEVFVSLASIRHDGTPEGFIRQDQPLRRGFYPSETPIKVTFQRTDFPSPGPYYLKVAGRRGSGGTATKEYTILAAPGTECHS